MFNQNSFLLLHSVRHHRITPKVGIEERNLFKTISHYPGITRLFLALREIEQEVLGHTSRRRAYSFQPEPRAAPTAHGFFHTLYPGNGN